LLALWRIGIAIYPSIASSPNAQAMQALYKHEASTIAPNLDGHLLSDFQHTLSDLSTVSGLSVARRFTGT